MEQTNRKYWDGNKKENGNEDLKEEFTESDMDLKDNIPMTCVYAPPEYFGFGRANTSSEYSGVREEEEKQTGDPVPKHIRYPFSHE